jgi:hypothetical protein
VKIKEHKHSFYLSGPEACSQPGFGHGYQIHYGEILADCFSITLSEIQ